MPINYGGVPILKICVLEDWMAFYVSLLSSEVSR